MSPERTSCVLAADVEQHGVVKQVVAHFGIQRPGFRLHALLANEGQAFRLPLNGVELDQVQCGRHRVGVLDIHQPVRVEVIHANGAELASLKGPARQSPIEAVTHHPDGDEVGKVATCVQRTQL